MVRTLFLVPLRDNEGKPFPRRLWRELRERLLVFGGYTRIAGVVGEWRSIGRVYRDRSYQFVIALESWKQFPAWLELVQLVHSAFRQEAIYVEVAGQPEILSW